MIYPCVNQCSDGTPRDLQSLLNLRSQCFGENYQYYHDNLGTNGHTGMDWPCVVGTPIYAAVAGRISYIASDFHVGSGGGAGVIIENAEGECLEWHFSRVDVQLNQQVSVGQQVGLSGNTGFSTAPHVHLEWRPYPLAYNNGFYGAVDFTSLMVWQSLPTSHKVMTRDEVLAIYKVLRVKDFTEADITFWVGKYWLDMLRQGSKDYAKDLETI